MKMTRSNKRSSAKTRRGNQSLNNNRQQSDSMICPVYKPVHEFFRTVDERFDFSTDGINPLLASFIFTLDQLPDYTDFTRLFDLYKIKRIELEWQPEYTELTDAALVSNAVNVYFNSVIDLTDGSAPSSVDELLQSQQLKQSGITKVHKRSWEPVIQMSDLVPCKCWLPTSQPSIRHYAIKVAIPPTGVAMTFRSRARFYVSCANIN